MTLRKITTVVALVTLFTLGACAGDDDNPDSKPAETPGTPTVINAPENNDIEYNEYIIPLEDGPLRCVWIRTNVGDESIGGPSCDWVTFNKDKVPADDIAP